MALIALIILRRAHRKKLEAERPEYKAELEGHSQNPATTNWFLRGKWRNENAAEERHELDSKGVRIVEGPPAELEAGK